MVPMRLCLHHTTLCFVFALGTTLQKGVMMQGGILEESGVVIRCLKTVDEDMKDFTQAHGVKT